MIYTRWGARQCYYLAAIVVLAISAVAGWQYLIGRAGGPEGFQRLNDFRNDALWLFPTDQYEARTAGGSFLAPSTFGHSNEFGGVLVLLLIGVDLCRRVTRTVTRFYPLVVGAGVAALLMSGSRSAQLAFVLYVVVSVGPAARSLLVATIAAVIAAFVTLQVAITPTARTGLFGRLESAATISAEDTVGGRLDSAVAAWRLGAARPFGVGVRTFGELIGTSHNSFLELVVTYGWILGVMSVALFLGASRTGDRRSMPNSALGAFAAAVFLFATEDRLGSPSSLLALALVVAVAVVNSHGVETSDITGKSPLTRSDERVW